MQNPLHGLNEQQQQVVQATHGPLLVLAGAGSGKTKALTHRIAYLLTQGIAAPHQIAAVTFTNKAAKEMKERIGRLLPSSDLLPSAVSTFHSLGVKLLREQVIYTARAKAFTIMDSSDSEKIVRTTLKEQNISLRDVSPRTMRQRISTAKNAGQTPQHILTHAENPSDELLGRSFARYEELLAKSNAYDFDDLLLEPVRLLDQHPEVRAMYQARWRFLSVDEYQDTNPIQDRLLRLLLGSEQNICVVGDDYQAIYSWRGANVDHILRFEQHYPNCQVIYLTQNYRSTPQILEAANVVIAHNTEQKHKELWTTNKTGNSVQLNTLASDRQEAGWVREQIQDHVREGGQLRDCAILYRTNAQSRLFEEEFLTHRMPYTIVGGFRFYDRREIKDALAFLYAWINPSARLPLERIASALLQRIGPKTIDRWENAAQQQGIPLRTYILQEATTKPQLRALAKAFRQAEGKEYEHVSDLLRDLLITSGYIDSLKSDPEGEEREQNIEELYTVASAYTDLETFLEDVALLSDLDTMEESSDRVTCMTLHASKGLEFPVVFVVGLEEGLLPHINSFDSQASMEEERRLLYVGMTRARQKLMITHAAQRYRAGEMTPQLPSRFLDHLPEQVERISHSSALSGLAFDNDASDDLHSFLLQATPAVVTSGEPVMTHVSAGEFVNHPQFGRGVVIDTTGQYITCVFERHGVKQVESSTVAPPL
ncbi:MAG: UvrD-helicase domain-containing protein [Candidatus Andersenbacteria bacterium]